jgi:hypothetical protein
MPFWDEKHLIFTASLIPGTYLLLFVRLRTTRAYLPVPARISSRKVGQDVKTQLYFDDSPTVIIVLILQSRQGKLVIPYHIQ